MLNVINQNPVTRENIPRPDQNANLMQVPNALNGAANIDVNQNLMQLPEQQIPLNINPDASFVQMLQNADETKKEHELQGNYNQSIHPFQWVIGVENLLLFHWVNRFKHDTVLGD